MSKKKFVSMGLAILMAFSMLLVPAKAFAQSKTYITSTKIAQFTVKSAKKNQLVVSGLTAAGKKKTKVTINATYKLSSGLKGAKLTTSDKKTKCTVVGLNPKAFAGSKAKTVVLKSTKFTKANVKNSFKGWKGGKKLTIKVPSSKLKAYKKIFTNANLGLAKSVKITVTKI